MDGICLIVVTHTCSFFKDIELFFMKSTSNCHCHECTLINDGGKMPRRAILFCSPPSCFFLLTSRLILLSKFQMLTQITNPKEFIMS